MANEFKTPGVYIEEIPKLPPSVASVETAIPAFIGYTEKAIDKDGTDLTLKPKRIASMLEYSQFFGGASTEKFIRVTIKESTGQLINISTNNPNPSPYILYYGMQLFFVNGGGDCYIVSAGSYEMPEQVIATQLEAGLKTVEAIDEVTLIVFPDALGLSSKEDYYNLHKAALLQCGLLQNRFSIMDVWISAVAGEDNIAQLRTADLGTMDELKYGAAYYPRLYSSLHYNYNDDEVLVTYNTSTQYNLATLKQANNSLYFQCKSKIDELNPLLPASPAIAGIYAATDNARGVWKAPVNINLSEIVKPLIDISSKQQEDLNVDAMGGKSVNVIRSFPGRGDAIVWGARTLAGNSNEWRYVSVRRFINMIEESTKKATEQFVFEPNELNTWVRIQSMIQNYLTQQWKAGALMGSSTKEAFFVHAGLGETMTQQDIDEGRLIVQIGLAVVRPAEFIILVFSHKMLQEQ